MIKNCIVCGNEFEGHFLSKYCSGNCRRQIRLARQRKPLLNNNCEVCGTVFVPRDARQICCSEPCRKIRKNQQARDRNGPLTISCPVCGGPFHPRGPQRYCSRICANSFRKLISHSKRPENWIDKPCKNCCDMFTPNRANQVFCSPQCYKYHHSVTRRKHVKCVTCGQDLVGDIKRKFCSDDCKRGICNWPQSGAICIICGNEFHARSWDQLCCSGACRKRRNRKMANLTGARWIERNPTYRQKFYDQNREVLNARNRSNHRKKVAAAHMEAALAAIPEIEKLMEEYPNGK